MRLAHLTFAAFAAIAFPVAAQAQGSPEAAGTTTAAPAAPAAPTVPAKPADEAAKPADEAAKPADEAAKPADEAAKPAEAAHEGAPAAKPTAAGHAAEHEGGEHGAAGEHATAHGEHHEEHGVVNWWSWDYGPKATNPEHRHYPAPFGFMLINFGIFLAILGRLLFKPLKQMAASRHEQIRRDLDAASTLRKEAEAKLREYEDKVKNVDAEIDALVAQLRTEAEAEKARIIANAEAEAVRLRADAQKQIDSEMARVKAELKSHLVDKVVAAAEAILTKNIGSDDQRKMAERYVTDLEKTGARS